MHLCARTRLASSLSLHAEHSPLHLLSRLLTGTPRRRVVQEAKREARQSKHVVDVRALQRSWAHSPRRAGVNDENAEHGEDGELLSDTDLSKVARVLKRHGAPHPALPLSPSKQRC